MENSIFPLLNVFCNQSPWQSLLPPAFHNPLVLPPNALHNQSLLPCRLAGATKRLVPPAMPGCLLSARLLALSRNPFIFSVMYLSLSGRSSAHPQSYFISLPPFLLKTSSLLGGLPQMWYFSLTGFTSRSQTNEIDFLSLYATCKWAHSLNLWGKQMSLHQLVAYNH